MIEFRAATIILAIGLLFGPTGCSDLSEETKSANFDVNTPSQYA